MIKSGDVILSKVQFTDTFEVKVRPGLVLYEEFNNYVVAGITSNTQMKGIPLTTEEGVIKNSIIKLNYLFTISKSMAEKVLFHLSSKKKKIVFKELVSRLDVLNA